GVTGGPRGAARPSRLERVGAKPAPAAPPLRPRDEFRLGAVRSRAAGSPERSRAPRRLAPRSVPASGGTPPHARRGAALVRRQRRRVPARVSERGAQRRGGWAVRAGTRRLPARTADRAARRDPGARSGGRIVLYRRASPVSYNPR